MAERESVNLLKSLLEYCDIPTNQLEEENKVLLSIDYETSILVIIEDTLIHFIGFLGKVIQDENFYAELLKENFKNCAQTEYRYSIDPNNDELLMSLSLQSNQLQSESFIATFQEFVTLCGIWVRNLNTNNPSIPDRQKLRLESLKNKDIGQLDPSSLEDSFLKV